MYKLFVLIALSLVSVSAFAEVPNEVPEPQTLALLAVGAAAALIAKRKSKRIANRIDATASRLEGRGPFSK